MTGSAPISVNRAEPGGRASAKISCWFAQAMDQRPADGAARTGDQNSHLSTVVNRPASGVSATKIASRLADSVVLAFSLIW
jgi:hypothetical protein